MIGIVISRFCIAQVLYSFSKDDQKQQNTLDNNRTTSTTDGNEHKTTLIVKRTTQTVRARSARNGHEKWNFRYEPFVVISNRCISDTAVFPIMSCCIYVLIQLPLCLTKLMVTLKDKRHFPVARRKLYSAAKLIVFFISQVTFNTNYKQVWC